MGILDQINDKVVETTGQVNNIVNNKDEDEIDSKPNIFIATIISVIGIISSIALFICLAFAFSYDLCIILDSYYLYIAGVLGVLMLVSVYICLKALKEKIIVMSIINIILSLISIIFIIIPLLTGLLYF